MKLVIQIPCYNEEEFITAALDALPRSIAGVDSVEAVVIDDGSSDRTSEIARAHPLVRKVVRLPYHQGLAAGFMAGIAASLDLGADIIVNTDADNQYPASRIPELIRPVLDGKAEFVIGCRNIEEIRHFSFAKKIAQRLGSRVVSAICGQQVPDVTSGFRAFSRNSALWLDVVSSKYTYTLETLIRLASRGIPISVLEISVNPPVRSSRLMKSSVEYVVRSAGDILKLFYTYSPLKLFLFFAALFGLPGLLLIFRFLYFYITRTLIQGIASGYIQSLTLGTAALTIGVFMLLMGVLSDLIFTNRKILEKILFHQHINSKNGR